MTRFIKFFLMLKLCFILPITLASSAPALLAQTGSSLLPLVKNRSMVNVVVHAPLNSRLQRTIQSHVNNLIQDDLELYFFYLDPKSVIALSEIGVFKQHFGESAWAIISPEGRLIASNNAIPTYEEFEKIMLSTYMTKPIPRLRQFLKQNPDNIDARAELIKLLRANAYRRTKQELNITQSSMLEAKDEKQYTLVAQAGFVIPDVEPFKELQLEPEKDLIIWAKYAQELSEAFQNGTWYKMNLAMDANDTLPLEVCSPTMKVFFRRIKPKIEDAIVNLPNTAGLWRLWLHVQACVDSQDYKFNFFDSIEAPPDVAGINWPPDGAVVPLTKYFYRQKNWDMILRLTDAPWEQIKNHITNQNNTAKQVPGYKLAIYIDWEGKFKPRLDALIMSGKQNEADDLVTLIYSTENGRSLVNSAIQSAKNMGAPNLVNKWQMLIGGVS